MTTPPSSRRLEDLLRDLTPQVLGAVMRRYHDFPTAEDAVQEALIAAATAWPDEGLPDNPRGWLIQVAYRRLTDVLRSDEARRRREEEVGEEQQRAHEGMPDVSDVALAPEGVGGDGDDALVLLFMCCHPSLTPPSAIALTLRAVGGLTTAEIAKAFLVPEATMAQRISRAKQTIKASGVPFQMPAPHEQVERLRAVLHVLYLMFNEGYASSIGPDLQRHDLANEAIRLARSAHVRLPGDTEVAGLLALMLLTDARRLARTNEAGDLIPLAAQDRTRWDQAEIREGTDLITDTLGRGMVGPYQLQASIAALHDEAGEADATDWPQILALYGLLERMSDNPVVTLNRAIALAMVQGPRAGLALIDSLAADPRMKDHHRLAAVRAHLLERAGEREAAVAQYREAAARTTSLPEQRYLLAQAARLSEVT